MNLAVNHAVTEFWPESNGSVASYKKKFATVFYSCVAKFNSLFANLAPRASGVSRLPFR